MSKRRILSSKAYRSNSLLSATRVNTKSNGSISADRELKRLGSQVGFEAKPIEFGSPSNAGGSSQKSSGGLLSQLLTRQSSSVISGLVGGGLFGLVGHSLFSGIGSLFGGAKQLDDPLERFSLPDSQNRTLDVAMSQAKQVQQASGNTNANGQGYSDRNAEIVRVVKQALLTSSQLNDIISEI